MAKLIACRWQGMYLQPTALRHLILRDPGTDDYGRKIIQFSEQLELWGSPTTSIRVGTVALCQAGDGVGLATYIDDYPGWLSFIGTEVVWSPDGVLNIESLYCPGNTSSAKR